VHALARFNVSGTLDTSFGTGGTILSSGGGITALGLDAAGNILTLPNRAEFSPPSGRPTRMPWSLSWSPTATRSTKCCSTRGVSCVPLLPLTSIPASGSDLACDAFG